MQLIKRVVFFISLIALYVIVRELIEIYVLARSLHPYVGYVTLALILTAISYFIILPILRILRIPVYKGPVSKPEKELALIQDRLLQFRVHPIVCESDVFDNPAADEREQYKRVLTVLHKDADKIRKRYVSQLFYTSSISQNGFIDAILILSSSVGLIKDMFMLYNGRVSNRDLLTIGKKVYYSMAIGGSEGVEYATEEIVSKFASDSVKGIPFIEKILGSVTDGFVNAVLLNRISYITENYCTMTYIKSDRDLSPSAKFIATATKNITSDMTDRLVVGMRRIAIDKPVDLAMMAVNPIRYFFTWTFEKVTPEHGTGDSWLKTATKDGVAMVGSPFTYVFGKMTGIFRKR